MHIITHKRIREFVAKYPDAETSLQNWYHIVSRTSYTSFPNVRQHFGNADYVDGFVVFNIAGNKYRLITVIHFNRQKVYIRAVLTRAEYDKNQWKK